MFQDIVSANAYYEDLERKQLSPIFVAIRAAWMGWISRHEGKEKRCRIVQSVAIK
jgi:hypothetical protein